MKNDTLHFAIKNSINEIIDKITKERNEFIEKYGYEPEFIEIDSDLYYWLVKHIKIELNLGIDELHTILGMKIKIESQV